MEELIKEAESLYNQIDKIQLDLVKSRLDVCEERKWKAISEMETSMCAVFQFLKCILERKNNIVDLGEVWHTSNFYNFPTVYDYYEIVAITDGDIIHDINSINDLHNWLRTNATLNIQVEWAYIKDLLPKGGE